jgi:pyruvate,orthophosphate dikinase
MNAPMTSTPLRWIRLLDGREVPAKSLIGGKAWSIASMRSQGLPVPPAFVVTTEAHAAFAQFGRLPEGLAEELAQGVAWLEAWTGKRFGSGPDPLLVSVRSGAPVSMPGMMDTVLNLGIDDAVEQCLAQASGNAAFARDTHVRFLHLYAGIVLKADLGERTSESTVDACRARIEALTGSRFTTDPIEHLHQAVLAVFESWNSRRAVRYRKHHGIPDALGTAVTVQAMVFGNLDEQSGTGVLFSRDPMSGEPAPYGEYLPRAQGEDVVSGAVSPQPLSSMAARLPEAHAALLLAATRLEAAAREVQDIEFTVERGRLYLLQTRAAKLAPYASARIAVDLVREGLIDETAALGRLSADRMRSVLAPRLAMESNQAVREVARGEGACPGVGIGRVVLDADRAEQLAAQGEPVVLVRPTTSPNDLHGMIAAVAVVTEEGGSTSHAAVVSRALGRPCVVGCGSGRLMDLVDRIVTVDGQTGAVYEGALPLIVPQEEDDAVLAELVEWATARSPLRVIRPDRASFMPVLDLDRVEGGADPARLGSLLGSPNLQRGVRGGCSASDEGVRAALAAGAAFIAAEPVLPVLLAAIRAAEASPA